MVPIVQDLIKELLESERARDNTEKTCQRMALCVLKVYMARVDLELESEASTSISIDFGGDIKALAMYRAGIKRARERISRWNRRQTQAIVEGM